jgi:hypothetical protein
MDGCRGRMSDFDFDLLDGYKLLRKGQLSGWGEGNPQDATESIQ